MLRERFVLATCVACLIAALAAQEQKQPPRFISGIDLVELDVSVLDRNRRPVNGLTAPDFAVLEDGQQQEILTFDEINLPEPSSSEPDWVRDIAPDVKSNALQDGRIVVLVIDDAMLPGEPKYAFRAKEIGREIVKQLGPNDLAAVVFTRDNSNAQDFTRDHARLLAAIDKTSGNIAGNCLFERYSVGTVSRTAQYLIALPHKRKALMLISVGVPVDFSFEGKDVCNLVQEMKDGLDNARRANLAIHTFDPTGLDVFRGGLRTDYLRSLAANTGGRAVVDTNDQLSVLPAILAETGSYYLIGYRAPRPEQDGKLRRVTVRVNKPGMEVRSRNGYFSPKPPKPDKAKPTPSPLRTAIAGLLPATDLPIEITAIPFARSAGREETVVIVAGLRQPAPQERMTQEVKLLTGAFGPEGESRGTWSQTATLTFTGSPDGVERYEVVSRIPLKPGRHHLRIAAHNATLGSSGSVYQDVDVPDFSKAALSASGIAVTAEPAIRSVSPNAVADLIPFVPTSRRDFAVGDRVAIFFRIYQGGRAALVPASVEGRIVDRTGANAATFAEAIDRERFGQTRAADYLLNLPIERLVPGSYVLTLDVKAGSSSLRRAVLFAVH